jgi:hypothetical protein
MLNRFELIINSAKSSIDFDIILYNDNMNTGVRIVRDSIGRPRYRYNIYKDIGAILGFRGTPREKEIVTKYITALSKIRNWFKKLICNLDYNLGINKFRQFTGYLDIDNNIFYIRDLALNVDIDLDSILLPRQVYARKSRREKRKEYIYNFNEDFEKWDIQTKPLP